MSEKVYAEMEKLGVIYAHAKAERVYLAEFRKAKKSILMKEYETKNPGCSAAIQEREAYANPEYKELLEGLRSAVEHEEASKNKLDVIQMRFESWRTKEATKRAEMGLR